MSAAAAAFAQRVAGHQTIILRYALKLTRDRDRAQDLAQDTIAHALEHAAQYQERGRMASWLLQMVHNLHVNHCRRENRRRAFFHCSIDELFDPATGTRTASSECRALAVPPRQEDGLEIAALARALALMPASRQQAILLVADGLRYEDAAAVLEVPVGTVRSRLNRGREELRRLMNGETILDGRRANGGARTRKPVPA